MIIPCEFMVWHVLPMLRRELAAELVSANGMSQADVARKFGVTDAAVSQYISRKRGSGPEFDPGDPEYGVFMAEIRESARKIAEDDADPSAEMCRLCGFFKGSGLIAAAYAAQTGSPPPKCSCYRGSRIG